MWNTDSNAVKSTTMNQGVEMQNAQPEPEITYKFTLVIGDNRLKKKHEIKTWKELFPHPPPRENEYIYVQVDTDTYHYN